MMKKKLIFLGLLLTMNCFAQEVNKFTVSGISEGIVYYLPKTEIEVYVVGEKKEYIPGELCQYANRFLGINNISTTASIDWSIKNIKINTIGLPDENNAFSIKLKDKSMASLVELTDNGIIKSINSTNSFITPKIKNELRKKDNKLNPRDYMTEEMLNATSTTKLAELVAKEIYNIRESKNSLTRGQADYMPQDGSALKLMLENLDKQEKALTQMFSGTTSVSEKEFVFNFTPNKDNIKEVLFRISKKLGIISSDNLAGEPVYIAITKIGGVSSEKENTGKEKDKKKEDGVIYNIPGKGNITISTSSKVYVNTNALITQFGSTEILSNGLFKKKINTKVLFSPITGGIMKIDKDE